MLTELTHRQVAALREISKDKYKRIGCPRYLVQAKTREALIRKGIIFMSEQHYNKLFIKKFLKYKVRKILKEGA